MAKIFSILFKIRKEARKYSEYDRKEDSLTAIKIKIFELLVRKRCLIYMELNKQINKQKRLESRSASQINGFRSLISIYSNQLKKEIKLQDKTQINNWSLKKNINKAQKIKGKSQKMKRTQHELYEYNQNEVASQYQQLHSINIFIKEVSSSILFLQYSRTICQIKSENSNLNQLYLNCFKQSVILQNLDHKSFSSNQITIQRIHWIKKEILSDLFPKKYKLIKQN